MFNKGAEPPTRQGTGSQSAALGELKGGFEPHGQGNNPGYATGHGGASKATLGSDQKHGSRAVPYPPPTLSPRDPAWWAGYAEKRGGEKIVKLYDGGNKWDNAPPAKSNKTQSYWVNKMEAQTSKRTFVFRYPTDDGMDAVTVTVTRYWVTMNQEQTLLRGEQCDFYPGKIVWEENHVTAIEDVEVPLGRNPYYGQVLPERMDWMMEYEGKDFPIDAPEHLWNRLCRFWEEHF